jgi:hypothetical protein
MEQRGFGRSRNFDLVFWVEEMLPNLREVGWVCSARPPQALRYLISVARDMTQFGQRKRPTPAELLLPVPLSAGDNPLVSQESSSKTIGIILSSPRKPDTDTDNATAGAISLTARLECATNPRQPLRPPRLAFETGQGNEDSGRDEISGHAFLPPPRGCAGQVSGVDATSELAWSRVAILPGSEETSKYRYRIEPKITEPDLVVDNPTIPSKREERGRRADQTP